MRRSAGFTLLEVLIAVAIFALISAMAYGALNQSLRTRDRVEEERLYWHALSLVFLRMEDDIGQARARGVRDNGGALLPPFVGQPTDARAVGAPNLELTRAGVPVFGEGVRSDLQRVAYGLADGVLTRLAWAELDRAPQSVPQEAPLLAGVEELRMRFYNATGRWEERWPPDANSFTNPTAGNELPRGVEVTLLLTGRGEITRLFLVHE
jgi:general secretion pathway protein J